jgi:hypothetical protein
MENSFLPENYEMPVGKSGGSYFSLEDGANVIRFLDQVKVGYEWWEERDGSNRPNRVKVKDDVPEAYKKEAKHFWANVIAVEGEIYVWSFTQKSIQQPVNDLCRNKQWGDPKGYDITITKSGKGLETNYTVMPNPKSTVDKEVKAEYKKWCDENDVDALVYTSESTNDDDLPF